MKAGNLFFFVSLFILTSCVPDKKGVVKDDSESRHRYYGVESRGWKSYVYTQKVNDISFKATDVPITYYMLKELGDSNLLKIDSLYEEHKTERVVEFEFLQDDQKDLLDTTFTGIDYKEGVKYMSFNIEKDFYVVTSKKDTIQCSGVTFERNFKVAPYNRLLLFFTGVPPSDNIQLIYNDRLFKKGVLKFSFNEEIINVLL
jgi:hypothetical protein